MSLIPQISQNPIAELVFALVLVMLVEALALAILLLKSRNTLPKTLPYDKDTPRRAA